MGLPVLDTNRPSDGSSPALVDDVDDAEDVDDDVALVSPAELPLMGADEALASPVELPPVDADEALVPPVELPLVGVDEAPVLPVVAPLVLVVALALPSSPLAPQPGTASRRPRPTIAPRR